MSNESWRSLCDLRKQTRERLISFKNTKKHLSETFKVLVQVFPDELNGVSVRSAEDIQLPSITAYPLELEHELDLMRLLLKDELKFPLTLAEITKLLKETVGVDISNLHNKVRSTLEKLDNQKLIRFCLDTNMITFVNFFTLRDVYQYKEENLEDTGPVSEFSVSNRKRALTDVFPDIPTKVPRKDYVDYWKDKAQELIAYKSFKERQHYETARQIHDLISTPTAKEMMKLEKFKCQEQRIIEFCTHLTLFECKRKQRFAFMTSKSPPKNTFCKKLHYRPVNNASTERKLGDCSFLNTCFHMETCKYIHYELDLNERCMKEFVEQDAKNVIRSRFIGLVFPIIAPFRLMVI